MRGRDSGLGIGQWGARSLPSAAGCKRTEDSSPRWLRRFNNMLFRGSKRGLTLRDVKNEGRSGYVHENTGDDDKMSCEKHSFLQKNAAVER